MKQKCPGSARKKCGVEMVEVRKGESLPISKSMTNSKLVVDYPKELGDLVRGKMYHEYRFACPRCKREWVYDSLWRRFEPIGKKSQMRYSWKKGYLVFRKK